MERTAGGITYTLTRRRVRNINLRVRADGSVAASASPRVPAAYVDAFVTARADWVRTAQARAAARREREAAEAPALPPKAEALAYMQALCRAYYPQFAATCPGGAMPKIAVRDMNTRWGSCSLRTARWRLRGGSARCRCPRRSTLLCMSSVTLPTQTTARRSGPRWRRCCRIISSGNGC